MVGKWQFKKAINKGTKEMKRLNYSLNLANDKSNLNLYSTMQQEVELGVQALKRESADMAITAVSKRASEVDG
jgi:hypothetical protein